ncbi:MAG: hypothetical protein HZA00_01080 [Nitrospinae bacterium]|nr:hypothetical protein [Nitrospinota bacterium]
MPKASDSEQLKKEIIKAFKAHWNKIYKNIRDGKPSLAKKRCGCFEADTEPRQRELAEKFYSIKHAKKMAELSDDKILKNISAYLPAAIHYVLDEYEDEPQEQKRFMRELVQGEYVMLASPRLMSEWVDKNYKNWEGWSVSPHPLRGVYDDWYGNTIGGAFFVCGVFVLTKSTGEPFMKYEIEWLDKAIFSNISDWDASETGGETLWQYSCEFISKNKI